MIGGNAGELVVAGTAGARAASVLVVPGNPGVADYYKIFCRDLARALGGDVAVCGAPVSC